jgi:ubiquinone/menaquinone biosynthesis C-methylase UbiE
MRKVIWATPLYKFLRYCNASPLDKKVLDCGAGGDDPPLQLFYEHGYETYGIEISGKALKQAQNFWKKSYVKSNWLKGDMRKIPFGNETFSFVYTYNAIHMMSKKDVALTISEIERVMKTNGLCFFNFVSADEPPPNGAKEINKGEFLSKTPWGGVKCPNIDSYLEDDEADIFFCDFEIIHKEKRIILVGKEQKQAYIDYIVRKNETGR